MKTKCLLLLALSIFLTNVEANAGIGEIERDSSGQILQLPLNDAWHHCESRGARLPSLREYAELAVSMGAVGVRETAYKGVDYLDPRVEDEFVLNMNDAFYPIYSNVGGATVIDFYFKSKGYQRPSSPYGNDGFWTSGYREDRFGEGFTFDGINGTLNPTSDITKTAVRCWR